MHDGRCPRLASGGLGPLSLFGGGPALLLSLELPDKNFIRVQTLGRLSLGTHVGYLLPLGALPPLALTGIDALSVRAEAYLGAGYRF